MHTEITLEQYLRFYHDNPAMRSTVLLANAQRTVNAMNLLCATAEGDGVELEDNPVATSPHFGTVISGDGNGGARPPDSIVGSALSAHKDCNALDRTDIGRRLMRWCLGNVPVLVEIGLWLEHPQWTRSWVHGQTVPPHSGNRFFLPYSDMVKHPTTCIALPEMETAGVRTFKFVDMKEVKK